VVPIRLFSHDLVNDLTDEELDELVGEDKETKEERMKLEVKTPALEQAVSRPAAFAYYWFPSLFLFM